MRDGRQFRAAVAALAGDDAGDRRQARPETALRAASVEELIEIVRDLSRRVAMVEVEIAGRRVEIEADD
jgi:hypothetical protein